jgi:hypothetical protein
MNSKTKGKRFELECAKLLSEVLGTEVRRTAQYCGKGGTADLVIPALPRLHTECKRRRESVTPDQAQHFDDQCERDREADSVPWSVHRADNAPVLCTVRAEHLKPFCRMLAVHWGWCA